MGRPGQRPSRARPTSGSSDHRLSHSTWRTVDWSAAACRDSDPELFFPVGEGALAQRQIEQAKAVCARCPLTARCLEWAMAAGVPEGIWGGYTERERRILRR
jgi:WhiB family transcriptional regulator, redox-sensing transcriptional regulator